jgi:hypothetical protein
VKGSYQVPGETIDERAPRTERAVILELLDREAALSHAAIHRRIQGVGEAEVEQAVTSLASVGLVFNHDGELRASDALKRLDELGMIPV